MKFLVALYLTLENIFYNWNLKVLGYFYFAEINSKNKQHK